MIGVVLLGDGSEARVLGMANALRCFFAVQAAGVERVVLIGDGADRLATLFARDGRARVAVESGTSWPAGGALVAAPGVVLDARATRWLAARALPGRRVMDEQWVLARTEGAGAGEQDLPENILADGEGVCALARTTAQRSAATAALLDSLRKPQDGWVSRAINRRISLAVTRGLVWLPVTPNALSGAILAVGLYGAWLASRGNHAALAVGGLLFQMQSVLDGCDGELSRLTFRGSKLGEWLDTVGDDLTNYSFFGAAGVGLARAGMGPIAFWLAMVGVAVGVVASGIEYRYLIAIGSGDLLKYPIGFGADPEPTKSTTFAARALGAIRPAFKRDFFVFLTMLAAFGGPYPMFAMLALFAGGAVATLGAVLSSEIRRGGRIP